MLETRIEYVINTFQSIYDLSGIDITVSYGSLFSPGTKILIVKSSLSERYFNSEIDINSIKPAYKTWMGRTIPFLFNDLPEKEILEYKEDGIIVNYDILGASSFLLSGYQEYECQQKDTYNRFRYQDSIQSKLEFMTVPLVNYYFEILKEALQFISGKEISLRPPFRDKPIGFISHDIDKCNTGYIQDGLHAVKHIKPGTSAEVFMEKNFWAKTVGLTLRIYNLLNVWELNPHISFDKKRQGWKYSCADYNIRSSKIKKVIKELSQKGSKLESTLHHQLPHQGCCNWRWNDYLLKLKVTGTIFCCLIQIQQQTHYQPHLLSMIQLWDFLSILDSETHSVILSIYTTTEKKDHLISLKFH
ncbi:MAG: hypothetical protein R2727_09005 [Bacteroidales bacterium]